MVFNKKVTSRLVALSAAVFLLAATIGTNLLLPAYAFAATASTPTTSPTQVANVSFTFDDGFASIAQFAEPTLSKYGLTGTSYVITNCIGMSTAGNTCRADNQKAYMTWEQVKTVYGKGWEIGSHTASHPLLASTDETDQPAPLTIDQIRAELAGSKQAIIDNAGITPTAFASPYGDYSPSGNPTLTEISKLYTSHRGFADTGYNVTPYSGDTLPADNYALNNYLLRDQQVQTSSNPAGTAPENVTVAQAKAMIDKAITDKAWLVLTFHDIIDGAVSATGESYDYSNADLDAIAAYVKEKKTAGLITNTNVSNGLPKPGATAPIINETFDNGVTSANGWTTDNPANVVADANNNGNIPSSTNSVSITGSSAPTHLFSPKVTVDANQVYVISCYVNITTAIGEIGFYVSEYDAAGNEIVQVPLSTGGGYKVSVNAGTNPHVAEVSFTYKPSTTAFMAALQIIAVTNATQTYQAYVDNVKMYSVAGAVTTPAPGSKAGDVNGDNLVNAIDLSTLLSNWNKTGTTKSQGDMNADGVINAIDLSTLLTNWGK